MDLDIAKNTELMVAQAEGLTEKGIEFVDRFNDTPELVAVDAGRIIIPQGSIEKLVAQAQEEGLELEVRDVTIPIGL